MAKNEKATLKPTRSNFTLIGKYKQPDKIEKAFSMNNVSDKGYTYSRMNIGLDCGAGNVVYADLMGGYNTAPDKKNVIFCHGKKPSEKDPKKMIDDWENSMEIDFDDRYNEHILEQVGDFCFYKVGIEKDTDGNIVPQKFLSAYDMIEYIKENLKDGSVLNIRGSIEYSVYQEKIQAKKTIKSIWLSSVEEEKDFKAEFTQSILVTKNSLGKPNSDTNTIPVTGAVVVYDKEVEGKYKPLYVDFELEFEDDTKAKTLKIAKLLFSPEKGVDEVNMNGKFVESMPTVNIEDIDIDESLQMLIDEGFVDEETVKRKAIGNEKKVRKLILTSPMLRNDEVDGETKTTIDRTVSKYTEENLIVEAKKTISEVKEVASGDDELMAMLDM